MLSFDITMTAVAATTVIVVMLGCWCSLLFIAILSAFINLKVI